MDAGGVNDMIALTAVAGLLGVAEGVLNMNERVLNVVVGYVRRLIVVLNFVLNILLRHLSNNSLSSIGTYNYIKEHQTCTGRNLQCVHTLQMWKKPRSHSSSIFVSTH